jgi:hypothetical protein
LLVPIDVNFLSLSIQMMQGQGELIEKSISIYFCFYTKVIFLLSFFFSFVPCVSKMVVACFLEH